MESKRGERIEGAATVIVTIAFAIALVIGISQFVTIVIDENKKNTDKILDCEFIAMSFVFGSLYLEKIKGAISYCLGIILMRGAAAKESEDIHHHEGIKWLFVTFGVSVLIYLVSYVVINFTDHYTNSDQKNVLAYKAHDESDFK